MKQNAQTIPFEDICIFLKKTYDRPGRLEHALLDYITLSQGEGTVRDLTTTRTNKLGILSRLGAEALPEYLDRALILRALSAPLSKYTASRHNHLKYSADEILRIYKTRELAVMPRRLRRATVRRRRRRLRPRRDAGGRGVRRGRRLHGRVQDGRMPGAHVRRRRGGGHQRRAQPGAIMSLRADPILNLHVHKPPAPTEGP
jgi:hypothetical protein